MEVIRDQRLRDIQREYLDFLDDDEDQGVYQQKVKDMIQDGESRLIVNINDLRRKNPQRASKLLTEGFEECIAFQLALKEFVASTDPVYSKENEEFYVGFEGSFGAKHVTPRTLTSRFLGNLVCLEGIVTKCSLVRPKIMRSVHYCPATKKTIERKYQDMTSLDPFPSTAVYPTKDDDGNPLETEYGLSTYRDHQTFSIQEMPEKSPAGQLPRSVDIMADDDLVDSVKPGDRVQVIGLYRCLPGKKNGYTTGTFRTIIITNNIQQLSKEQAPTFTADDISKIKKFARNKKMDVFEALGRSLAPTIHGHEYIKKAVLCQLLGGTEKVLENGSRIRGDINILLIGDPSVAKSQMLRYVLNSAPRAITTTGRGSSGVGLTAAVTTDQETGERRLEAGAMVLGDRGVVCIDEFDKMSDMDRTAIHEVMEQGRVTIAKAGIHAKLNARCSVLAAANPVYGRYDQYKTPMENIGLQDSLLSRFDLLFVVLDKMDPDSDRRISDHVLRIHQYRGENEEDGDALPMTVDADLLATTDPDQEQDNETETPVYEKFDNNLHDEKSKKQKLITMKFMRKYIHVARDLKPVITRESADFIADEYSKLRNQDNLQAENVARTQPITARSLETMIRLSTAHAKCRLSKTVDLEDAQAALELVQFACFKKVEKRQKKRRINKDSDDDSDDDNEKRDSKRKRKRRQVASGEQREGTEGDDNDPYDFDSEAATEDEEEYNPSLSERRRARSQSADSTVESQKQSKQSEDSDKIGSAKLKQFKTELFNLFKSAHAQSLSLQNVKSHLLKENTFNEDEIMIAIDKMMDDNQIMLADDIIFLI